MRALSKPWCSQRVIWALLVAGVVSSACSSAAPTPDQPTAISPAPTPTAEVQVRLTRWSIRQDPPGALGFVSLVSGQESSEVVLEVSLVDKSGTARATGLVPALTPYLLRSSEAFFVASFPDGSSGTDLRVKVVSSRPAPQAVETLMGSIVSTAWLSGGGLSLVGRLENPSSRAIAPTGLVVVGLGVEGLPLAYAEGVFLAPILWPGELVPFRADVSMPGQVHAWMILAHGLPLTYPRLGAITLDGEIALRQDPQGRPFAIGRIINGSDSPRSVRVGILVTIEDEWLSLGVFETPTFLPPRSTLPFVIDDFPGLEERLAAGDADWGDLNVEAFLNEVESDAAVIQLETEVTGYEVIGSRLYLRGQIRNEGPSTIAAAAVVAGVLSAGGDLLTSGWAAPAERLAPSLSADFLLVMPVPKGADLTLAEYDVRGFGIED